MTGSSGFVPYCGLPPTPGAVSWNLDPWLFAALFIGAALYSRRVRREPAVLTREKIAFFAGWAVVAVAMMSPLCNLGVALFSARIVQHMAISIIAAPLLVFGRADLMVLSSLSRRPMSQSAPLFGWERVAGPGLFAAVLWFWHLARPYDSALTNNILYWAMDLSLFITAVLLWRGLLRDSPGYSLVASVFTGMQMCVLGALLALSARPWFSVHFMTTWAWGLSPLQDQHLGGLIMWVPGGMLLTIFTIASLGRQLSIGPRDKSLA